MLRTFFSKILGSRNNKLIKHYRKQVQVINALETEYSSLSDAELQNAFNELKVLVQSEQASIQSVLHRSFAITREK